MRCSNAFRLPRHTLQVPPQGKHGEAASLVLPAATVPVARGSVSVAAPAPTARADMAKPLQRKGLSQAETPYLNGNEM